MNADYTITRESEYGGLMVVRYQGRKIGTSQTEAAARIIRRNHIRRNAA